MPGDAIAPHVTAYVGGENDVDCCLYALWRDGRMLVIQAAPVLATDEDPTFLSVTDMERLTSEFNYGLEKISLLLPILDFNRSNWAYLVNRDDGSQSIIYKSKPMHRMISAGRTWAPLVDESEIVTTKFLSAEYRQGIWKGMNVGQRALRGLDLTFDVLGHVTRDGCIVGIMTESVTGRMVEYPDRSIVYDAITKVQSRGLIYSVQESNIMVVDGKVRLLSLSSIRKFTPGDRFVDVNRFHWDALSRLFDKLFAYPNFMSPLHSLQQRTVKVLAPTPPLSRHMPCDPLFKIFVFANIPPPSMKKLSSTKKQALSVRSLERHHEHSHHPQSRRHSATPYQRHPPHTRNIPSQSRLLLISSDSDTSSETDSAF
ncbi:hypothetical protein ONZ45_g1214 [Pleurotus djamor]|nr:hypothetical protein ONZ45_g1214 [Pleurotus djamor]